MLGTYVLVTGGLGAIGSALCRALLARDIAHLTIIDDCSSANPALSQDILADQRVAFIDDSIVHDAVLEDAFSTKQEIVFHLAAHFANQNSIEDPISDTNVNSIGTIKVLEASRKAKVQKFIFASSSCVYGNANSFSIDTRDFHLDTPYAINKLHGEYLVKFYHDYHGMNTTILRYFNSFGHGEMPGRYRNVIPNFFALAMAGKPLPITGNSKASRDFNYVENVVMGTLLAAEKPASNGKLYNIGSGVETSIGTLATHINAMTGNAAGTVLLERRSWDTVLRRCADISEAVKDLGYQPVIDLEAQLQSTYEWLQRYRDLFPAL